MSDRAAPALGHEPRGCPGSSSIQHGPYPGSAPLEWVTGLWAHPRSRPREGSSHRVTGILMASPACGLPPLAAFKQSPPAVPALGTNVKKRRHGDEDVYYMHVSGCGVLRAGTLGSAGGRRGAGRGSSQPARLRGCDCTAPLPLKRRPAETGEGCRPLGGQCVREHGILKSVTRLYGCHMGQTTHELC